MYIYIYIYICIYIYIYRVQICLHRTSAHHEGSGLFFLHPCSSIFLTEIQPVRKLRKTLQLRTNQNLMLEMHYLKEVTPGKRY